MLALEAISSAERIIWFDKAAVVAAHSLFKILRESLAFASFRL